MSNSIEIEAKALLSEEDYRKLIETYGFEHIYEQTNFYIDSKDRVIKKNHMSLRVRKKNNKHELTLKSDLEEGRLERNIYISSEDFENLKNGVFPDGEIKNVLIGKTIDLGALEFLTSLATKRLDICYQGGIVSIDENHYGNNVDYEIEIEHESMEKAESSLKSFLAENGIEYKKNTKSKTARALEALK